MSQPISMPWSAPVFPKPPHSWEGVDVAVFTYTPNLDGLAAALPPGFEPAEGMGLITMLSYPDSVVRPFKELVVLAPVTVDGVPGNYIPHIFVTTDEALIAGREIAGYPKLLADIEWERDGDNFHFSASRWGAEFLNCEGTVTGPAPEGMEQMQSEASSRPTYNYKLIPGPAGEIEVEEITSTNLEVVPTKVELGTAKLTTNPADGAMVSNIVPSSEGMLIVMKSNNVIPPGTVVKRISGRVETPAGVG